MSVSRKQSLTRIWKWDGTYFVHLSLSLKRIRFCKLLKSWVKDLKSQMRYHRQSHVYWRRKKTLTRFWKLCGDDYRFEIKHSFLRRLTRLPMHWLGWVIDKSKILSSTWPLIKRFIVLLILVYLAFHSFVDFGLSIVCLALV